MRRHRALPYCDLDRSDGTKEQQMNLMLTAQVADEIVADRLRQADRARFAKTTKHPKRWKLTAALLPLRHGAGWARIRDSLRATS